MDEVKITIRTATGAVLHSMDELDEYIKSIEFPDFIQDQIDRMYSATGKNQNS